jgi:hypothetical protein
MSAALSDAQVDTVVAAIRDADVPAR